MRVSSVLRESEYLLNDPRVNTKLEFELFNANFT